MSQRHYSSDDLRRLESRFRTQLVNSLTGFKSLSLIGTADKTGHSNLALFSQVIHVGANPPFIGILSRPNSVPRHTLENVLETNFFTVNHVQEKFYKAAHLTSARWDISEFDAVGLHEQYLEGFFAPFVEESNVKIGCKLNEVLDVKSNGTHLLIGEMVHVHLDDSYIEEDGFIDIEKAGTITVSGLDSYHETRQLERLPYAKPVKKESDS